LKASVIDLGFNSVKMFTYTVETDVENRPCNQASFKVKLGEGLDETGFLGKEPMTRTVDSLRIMRDLAALDSVRLILPIATSAVREAANGGEFMRQVDRDTGIRFRVLSAEEEALLSYAGAVGFNCLPDAIFFDLGGGSLEVVGASGFRVRRVLSLPLGALRLSYAYGRGDGTFSKRGFDSMKDRVAELLPPRRELNVGRLAPLLGVGGVLRALARLDMALIGHPINKLHSYSMKYKAVDSMSKMLAKMSREELVELAPISNRFETMVAGAYVVKALMKSTAAGSLTVSTRGLRDGALSIFQSHPRSFHEGRVTRSQVEGCVMAFARKRAQEPASVAEFSRAGLVDEKQRSILREAHRLCRLVPPTTDLQALFFSVMGEDSPLSHPDQLIAAFAIIGSRDPKSISLFLDEYRGVVERKGRRSLPRLAAILALTQVLERTGTRVKLRKRGRRLVIHASSAAPALPESLLSARTSAVGETFGLQARFLVRRVRPGLGRPSLLGRTGGGE
jgi:exopolyphosphatase/guanosine-5'-triphosphate,3'-diphosphate pyrophosphatase